MIRLKPKSYAEALKIACSLASLSGGSEVFKILPPVPFNSSSTLSGVAFFTRTKSVELPGIMEAASSFMNGSLIPASASEPETAPAANPNKGFIKIKPLIGPQKAELAT